MYTPTTFRVLSRTRDTLSRTDRRGDYYSRPENRNKGRQLRVVVALIRKGPIPNSLTPGKCGLISIIKDWGWLDIGSTVRAPARKALAEAKTLCAHLLAGNAPDPAMLAEQIRREEEAPEVERVAARARAAARDQANAREARDAELAAARASAARAFVHDYKKKHGTP